MEWKIREITQKKSSCPYNFLPAILGAQTGAGNGCANLLGTWKMRSFCRKKSHVHKIPRFRGGGFGLFLGGRVPILFFMGARIFLTLIRKRFCGVILKLPRWKLIPMTFFGRRATFSQNFPAAASLHSMMQNYPA